MVADEYKEFIAELSGSKVTLCKRAATSISRLSTELDTTQECLAYILKNNKNLNVPLGMTIEHSI